MKQDLLKYYFNIIRRWFWLLALAVVAAGLTTYWVESQQPPIYEAKVQLVVGPGMNSLNPDLNALRAGGQLLQTYAEFVKMEPVLQAIIDDLNLEMSPARLGNSINVVPNREAQILAINVQAKDPDQAVSIANTLAKALVGLSPSGVDNSQAQTKDQLRSQAEKIEGLITSSELLISDLETKLQAATDTEQQGQVMEQLSDERTRLTESHETLTLLYRLLQEASINQINVVEPATNATLVDNQFQFKMMIGVLSGLVLSLVIVLGFEYFDTTIKAAEDLNWGTQVPLLGAIARHKKLKGVGRGRLVVEALPDSDAAEDYRTLGVKLLSTTYSENAEAPALGVPDQAPSPRSILISSLQSQDDTAEIGSNLAVVLAQAGQKVILVDANLQQPVLGQMFGLVEQEGVTTALIGEASVPQLINVDWLPGLSILPAGPVPANPFELLASPSMTRLIEQLERRADVVIITASSLSSSANSLIMASRVDGVMIVARNGRTQREMIEKAVDNLNMLKANIIGLVLDPNHSSRRTLKFWGMRTSPARTGQLPEGQPVSLVSN